MNYLGQPHPSQVHPSDLHQHLWANTGLFESRYEQSACALIAIAQALEQQRSLTGAEQEFLGLYTQVAQAQPVYFNRVWSDPTAFAWMRLAYDLVKASLTGTPLSALTQDYTQALGFQDPHQSLAFHLDSFKRFVLAINHLSGRDCRFERPWSVKLPVVMPGTCLYVDGEGEIDLWGLVDGALQVSHAGGASPLVMQSGSINREHSLQVKTCPRINWNQSELRLQPYSLDIPGFEDAQLAIQVGVDYQERHQPLVQQALDRIEQYQPRLFQQLQQYLQLLVLVPLGSRDYTNLSHSDLPGALICSVIDNPWIIAEAIIHEFHHNRLFCIEEITPLLSNSSAPDIEADPLYYSPWRPDLRPLRGVLHALYVFIPVCWFWLQVYCSDQRCDRIIDYGQSQLKRIPWQLDMAIQQLDRYARFTHQGKAVFTALAAEVQAIHAQVEAVGLPQHPAALVWREDGAITPEANADNGAPLTVQQALSTHIRAYDRKQQCRNWLPVFQVN